MKSLREYICENYANNKVELPYTLDIYNEGEKNKDHKITKAIFYKLGLSNHWKRILCPKGANEITYKDNSPLFNKFLKDDPNSYIDDNFVLYFSSKYYGQKDYDKRWEMLAKSLKPYMKNGKISVTINKSTNYNIADVELYINDDKFNKDREEKIKEMTSDSAIKKINKEFDERIKKSTKNYLERIKKLKEKMINGTATDDELVDLYIETSEDLEKMEIARKIKDKDLRDKMMTDAKNHYYANE